MASGRPYCAPGWMLPWWEHLRPDGARLHAVLVADGDRLVGLAPLFAQPGPAGRCDVRVLTAGLSHGLDLLGAPGALPATAAAVTRSLRRTRPTLVSLEGFAASTPWPDALRAAWPGRLRPARLRTSELPSPSVALPGGTADDWLAGRSRNFRQQVAQSRRRLEREGGEIVLETEPVARAAAIGAFERLHAARWSDRGGSNLVRPGVGAMLRAAAEWLPPDRLRLFTAKVAGRVVAVQVLVAAGGEVAYWNGGWDEDHARLRPALITLVAAVQDAFRRGDRRVDLGGGADPYKLRLADEPVRDAVATRVLLPVTARYPLARAALLAPQLRRAARGHVARLPEARRRQVLAAVRRARALTPSA